MRITTRTITKAIQAAGINGELVRGSGYYYFTGPAFEGCPSTSVMTYHIGAYSVEDWIAVAAAMKAQAETVRGERIDADAQRTVKLVDAVLAIVDLVPDEEAAYAEDFARSTTKLTTEIEQAGDRQQRERVAEAEAAAVKRGHTTPAQWSLTFYEIEHNGDLQDAVDALTAIGCKVLRTGPNFEAERALVVFETTMSLKDVKELLSYTSVVL